MLHVKKFRKVIPVRLRIDRKGRVPLPGDSFKDFDFEWPIVLGGFVSHLEMLAIFERWKKYNLKVVVKHLKFIKRNADAIRLFEKACDAEREKRLATYRPIHMQDPWEKALDRALPDVDNVLDSEVETV